jgi:hypothetical protein
MDFLKDLWGFLNQRKKLWLLPAILVLLVFGTVIVLTGEGELSRSIPRAAGPMRSTTRRIAPSSTGWAVPSVRRSTKRPTRRLRP